MKKILLLSLPILALSITGCTITLPHSGDEKDTLTMDEGTPDWWVSMWTFENVTIKIERTAGAFSSTEDCYYKVINSKYYFARGEAEFEEFDTGDQSFQMFRYRYKTFNMAEGATSTSCIDWKKYDDNDWLYDEEVTISEGKVTKIVECSHYNSLYIEETYTFYDYGTTTL